MKPTDGLICILIDPVYTIDVNGRSFSFEWNERFGPTVLRKDGSPRRGSLSEKHPFWKPFGLWIENGQRVDDEGRCLLEPDAAAAPSSPEEA
jgi:hypothetical protein